MCSSKSTRRRVAPQRGHGWPKRPWTRYTAASPFPRSRSSSARVRSSSIAVAEPRRSRPRRAASRARTARAAPARGSRWRAPCRCRRARAGRGAAGAAAGARGRGSHAASLGERPSASGPRCASSAASASGVSSHTPARFFLPGLGEDELAAVREAEPEHRRLRALGARGEVAEPPGAHQVHAQDELAVLGREEQVLAAPLASPRSAGPRAPRAAGRTSSAWRCARGPPCRPARGRRAGSSSRTQASTSGSSGMSWSVATGGTGHLGSAR